MFLSNFIAPLLQNNVLPRAAEHKMLILAYITEVRRHLQDRCNALVGRLSLTKKLSREQTLYGALSHPCRRS